MRNILSRRERLVLILKAKGEDRIEALEREIAIMNQRVMIISLLGAYLKSEEFEEWIQRKLVLPISKLKLSKKTGDAIKALSFETLGDICKTNPEALMADCGFDEAMVSVLKGALEKEGLFWRIES